ncbi:MAG: DUF1848 family protein, partial [Desulfuromonadaceae bacterium]
AWHLERAEMIADALKGATRRLLFSFCDFYGKGKGRLDRALAGTGITLEDITAPERRGALEKLAIGFREIADRHSLRIATCSEDVELADIGIEHGACIDGALIRELFGAAVSSRKDRNQRDACRCAESVDMGMYNSCRFRCAYCYATFNEGMIESNCRKHHPDSPSLLHEYDGGIEIRTRNHRKRALRRT